MEWNQVNLFTIPNLEGGFLTAELVIWGANNFLTNALFHCAIAWLINLEICVPPNKWDLTLGQKLGLIGIEFPIPTSHLASMRIDPHAFSLMNKISNLNTFQLEINFHWQHILNFQQLTAWVVLWCNLLCQFFSRKT